MAAFLKHSLGQRLGRRPLEELLGAGAAFVLLDGLDEIGSVSVRKDLRDAVQEGLRRYKGCRWLLTSRIVGYDHVPFHIGILSQDKEQQHSKSAIASTEEGVRVRYVAPFDDKQIQAFATNWYMQREDVPEIAEEKARDLVRQVHEDASTTRLARIPNLLAIMALIHRIRARLPEGKALLYTDIAQAYLESID